MGYGVLYTAVRVQGTAMREIGRCARYENECSRDGLGWAGTVIEYRWFCMFLAGGFRAKESLGKILICGRSSVPLATRKQ